MSYVFKIALCLSILVFAGGLQRASASNHLPVYQGSRESDHQDRDYMVRTLGEAEFTILATNTDETTEYSMSINGQDLDSLDGISNQFTSNLEQAGLHSVEITISNSQGVTVEELPLYVPDTIWSTSSPNSGSSLSDIAYSPELSRFVTISREGLIAISDDGINWSVIRGEFEGNAPEEWYSVAYFQGRFIASGKTFNPNGAATWTSSDGVVWKKEGSPKANYEKLEVLNDKLWAYSFSGYFILSNDYYVSEDGLNWETRFMPTIGFSSGIRDIAYGNQTYIVGIDGGLVLSQDGINWTSFHFSEDSIAPLRLTFGGGFFYLSTSNTVYRSQDGLSWVPVYQTDNSFITDLLFHEGQIAVAIQPSDNPAVSIFPTLVVFSNDHGNSWKVYPIQDFPPGGKIYPFEDKFLLRKKEWIAKMDNSFADTLPTLQLGNGSSPAIANTTLQETGFDPKTFVFETNEPVSIPLFPNGTVQELSFLNLPDGVFLDEENQRLHGTISKPGFFHSLGYAKNQSGFSAPASLRFFVLDPNQDSPEFLTSSTKTVQLTTGEEFKHRLVLQGIEPELTASNLPPGIFLNENTRSLEGTPSQLGFYDLRITATKGSVSVEQSIPIEVGTPFTPNPLEDFAFEFDTQNQIPLPDIPNLEAEIADPLNRMEIIQNENTFLEGSFESDIFQTDGVANLTMASDWSIQLFSKAFTLSENLDFELDQPQEIMVRIGDYFGYEISTEPGVVFSKFEQVPDGLETDGNRIWGTLDQVGDFQITMTFVQDSQTLEKILQLQALGRKPKLMNNPGTVLAVVDEPVSIPINYSYSPEIILVENLPPGLEYDESSGNIAGAPNQTSPEPVTVSLEAQNEFGEALDTFQIRVFAQTPAPPSYAGEPTLTFYEGVAANRVLSVDGIVDNYLLKNAQDLPPGLLFNEGNGAFSGSPLEQASAILYFDLQGPIASQSIKVNIDVGPDVLPNLVAPRSIALLMGEPILQELTFKNNPTEISVENLPAGLEFNPQLSSISGTPEQTGTFLSTVFAANDKASVESTLPFHVNLPKTSSVLFQSTKDLGNDWLHNSWFGLFLQSHYPWIYQPQLGWLYVRELQVNEPFFYIPGIGWIWTAEHSFPYAYSYSDQDWIWFNLDKTDSRQIFRFSIREFEVY